MPEPLTPFSSPLNEERALIAAPEPLLRSAKKIAYYLCPALLMSAGVFIELAGIRPPAPSLILGGGYLILAGMAARRALSDTPVSYWQKIEEYTAAALTLSSMTILPFGRSSTCEALGFVACILSPAIYGISCCAPHHR